ncbi:ethanolamine-phosphate phospho-lyase-like [Halichondria panicea]|uniref:ethanolamine-phosphate phospho-lyase-like n=1 Tax=Halichondria panicea TaxID=6063 RepID=UPI00312BA441
MECPSLMLAKNNHSNMSVFNGSMYSSELEPSPSKKRKTSSNGHTVSKPVAIKGEELLNGKKSTEEQGLKIVRSKGQYLWDENDQKYLDIDSNISHVGHCNEKVVQACTAQMAILNTNSRFLNDQIVTYAKHLCSKFPKPLSCCFFTNSGSEANDLALQIAQVVTGRKHTVGLLGANHGQLMSLKQLSSHVLRESTLISGDVSIAPLPDSYRQQYTDLDTAGMLYAEDLKKLVEGKDVSAFIHESIFSGAVVPPHDYFQHVYKYIHSVGGLCIADEGQTGFGRLGEHFWAFESHGVCPDIVTLGNSMGNGHPVAAVVTTKDIADKFAASGVEYFNTFGGNPVSMATAEAVLSVVEEDRLQGHAKEMGDYLKARLEALKEKHTCVGDVRGSGLLLGVDFVKDPKSKEPAPDVAHFVQEYLLIDHQIIAHADSRYNNVINIKPPMVVSREDCQSIAEALNHVLMRLEQQT